jgi:hypothetical protein
MWLYAGGAFARTARVPHFIPRARVIEVAPRSGNPHAQRRDADNARREAKREAHKEAVKKGKEERAARKAADEERLALMRQEKARKAELTRAAAALREERRNADRARQPPAQEG